MNTDLWPEVDVLIPVFNRAQFLKEALESVENQTYPKWRVVIYDDGSTDGTPDVAAEFCKRHPKRSTYVRSNVNKGVAHARNVLLEHATAPLAAWQDSDDISHVERLERMVKQLDESSADMAFSGMYFFKHPAHYQQTKTVQHIRIAKYKSREGLFNNMNFATAVFRTALREYRFRPELQRKEDAEWLTQLINAKKVFAYAREPLYYCRRHPGRLTNGGRFDG